jgi:excisionase family DNA binding protein
MARLIGRRDKVAEEKILDVDASMQGTMVFKDPVNLKINGRFEGNLTTRGNLTIGETAVVNANIEGDDITISGAVIGNIKARTRLRIIAPARVTGDIEAPILGISEGAAFQGKCHMGESSAQFPQILNLDEVAEYLEVKPSVVNEWASQGKIPAMKDDNKWRFEKVLIDEWISKERVK